MARSIHRQNYCSEQIKSLELNEEQKKVFDTLVEAFNTFAKDAEALDMKYEFKPIWSDLGGIRIMLRSWCEKDFFTGAALKCGTDLKSGCNPAEICDLHLAPVKRKDIELANFSYADFGGTPSLYTVVPLPKDSVGFYYRVIPYVRTASRRIYNYDHKKGINFETLEDALRFLKLKRKESGESWVNSLKDVEYALKYIDCGVHTCFRSKQEKLSHEGYLIIRVLGSATGEDAQ